MTVKELIKNLKKMPQDALVIYSSDDEGNSYQTVSYDCTLGKFEGEYRGDFFPATDSEDSEEDRQNYENSKGKKAVCIN